jgi:hypothetical protein
MFCLPMAWLLYLLTRQFVVNSKASHVALFCLMLVVTSIGIPIALGLLSTARLRHEKQNQREIVASRVAQAGGWEALRSDCLLLIEKHRDEGFHWGKWSTNTLPASIAALKPWYVDYDSYKSPEVKLIRIKVFGIHSTGGHSIPYLGLEIVTGPGSRDYLPEPAEAASGNAHAKYSKVAEDIYETY